MPGTKEFGKDSLHGVAHHVGPAVAAVRRDDGVFVRQSSAHADSNGLLLDWSGGFEVSLTCPEYK